MKDNQLYLVHIQECIEKVEQYCSGGKDAFFNDSKTQDAIIRNLQILSESTQRISEVLKLQHPEIDWKSIAAFRNAIVHEYLGMDISQVWDVIENDLPDLKAKIVSILQQPPKN